MSKDYFYNTNNKRKKLDPEEYNRMRQHVETFYVIFDIMHYDLIKHIISCLFFTIPPLVPHKAFKI